MLDHQPARIGTVPPRVPARGRRAGHARQRIDGDPQMLALGRLVDVLVVDPAVAMAGDLVAEIDEGRCQLGVALERHRHAEDRQGQAAPLELAQDAPGAGPRSVLVAGFHRQVSRRISGGADELGQELLGMRVAVEDAALARLPRS